MARVTMTGAGGVTIDAEIFLERITTLTRPRLDKPVALALVDTAKSAIGKASSLIAKRTGLKAKVVRQRIVYDRVREGDYHATIRSSRRHIPMIEFPRVRQANAGVRVNVWGRAQILQGAFIATMPTGHRGVFRRAGRSRLPIKEMFGPTIHGTFATPDVLQVIRDVTKTRLRAALLRRIKSEQRRRR